MANQWARPCGCPPPSQLPAHAEAGARGAAARGPSGHASAHVRRMNRRRVTPLLKASCEAVCRQWARPVPALLPRGRARGSREARMQPANRAAMSAPTGAGGGHVDMHKGSAAARRGLPSHAAGALTTLPPGPACTWVLCRFMLAVTQNMQGSSDRCDSEAAAMWRIDLKH